MSKMKVGLLAVAVACLLGTSTAAWACNVYGSIVCKSDSAVGVSGVDVILTQVPEGTVYSTTSSADGTFYLHVNTANRAYDVNLDGQVFCDASGTPIYMDAIQVDDALQCPGEPPPPPACVPTIPTGVTFPYCPAHPLGNPKSECSLFGLVVLDQQDTAGGSSVVASTTAALALVKAGGCYDVFLNVVADQTLLTAPFTQGISHVTYCTCPTP